MEAMTLREFTLIPTSFAVIPTRVKKVVMAAGGEVEWKKEEETRHRPASSSTSAVMDLTPTISMFH
eukprot:768056-Hanusia_phi.AAC.11